MTKKYALEILKGIAEEKNFPGPSFAAAYVIENYQDYDYNGTDRLFLAFCEEMVDSIVLSPEESKTLTGAINNPSKPNADLKAAVARYEALTNVDNK